MSNETTQLQKAIVIAVKDGWVETDPINGIRMFYKDFHLKEVLFFFAKYTTDLNYLMPLAVKVLKELWKLTEKHYTDETPKMFIKTHNVYDKLREAILILNLDSNNQYTELFNSLYEVVKLLENE